MFRFVIVRYSSYRTEVVCVCVYVCRAYYIGLMALYDVEPYFYVLICVSIQ